MFPYGKRIGIFAQVKNAAAGMYQFMMEIPAYRRGDKTDRIFPDVMQAHESMRLPAVDEGQGVSGKSSQKSSGGRVDGVCA